MPLTPQQIRTMIQIVIATQEEDQLDCGGCLNKMAQFAELKLEGTSIPEAMETVQVHMENCPCCGAEFEALLAAIRAIEILDGPT